jgi:hypothetical protein
MGQIKFTIALVLIGLFTVAVLGFAINFAVDNTVYVDIANDSEISDLYTRTGGNLSNFAGNSEESYQSIAESTLDQGDITTLSGGQFKITPVSAMGLAKNVLRTGYIKIFGRGSGFGIFITTFIALLVFIAGMLIWRIVWGRQVD